MRKPTARKRFIRYERTRCYEHCWIIFPIIKPSYNETLHSRIPKLQDDGSTKKEKKEMYISFQEITLEALSMYVCTCMRIYKIIAMKSKYGNGTVFKCLSVEEKNEKSVHQK